MRLCFAGGVSLAQTVDDLGDAVCKVMVTESSHGDNDRKIGHDSVKTRDAVVQMRGELMSAIVEANAIHNRLDECIPLAGHAPDCFTGTRHALKRLSAPVHDAA